MFTNFKEFIISILELLKGIFDAIEPGLTTFIGLCIVFLVALAIKRGVSH